jgi:hypothetical protein
MPGFCLTSRRSWVRVPSPAPMLQSLSALVFTENVDLRPAFLGHGLGFRVDCLASGHIAPDFGDPVRAVVPRRRMITKKLESGKTFLEP